MSAVLNKRWPLIVGLTLMTTLVFASPAVAGEIIEGGNPVIGADEVIEDDLVLIGDTVTMNGTVQGDLVALGSTIIVNGTVEGDILAAGQEVIVNGEMQDDAYLAGFLVKLGEDAALSDELIVGTFSLEAGHGSSVGGDLLFGGFQALLQGDIAGGVTGSGSGIQIDGTIHEDVELSVSAPGEAVRPIFGPDMPDVANVPSGVTLGDNASIGGDLTYTSTAESNIPDRVVAGTVDFTREVVERKPQPAFRVTRPGEALGFFIGQFALKLVRRFLTLALVGLLIVWLGSKLLTDTVDTFKARPWASLGVGALGYVVFFGVMIILPLVLILLSILLGIISLGGLTGGVIAYGTLGWGTLLVAFITATSWLAKIVLAAWLGLLIWKLIQPEGTSLVLPLLIGVLLAVLLTAIPLGLGWLINLAIALFGLGSIILTLRKRLGLGRESEPAPAV